MSRYRILPGHTFRDADSTVKTGGETIELDADVAAAHPHSVELPAEPPEASPAADPPPTRRRSAAAAD